MFGEVVHVILFDVVGVLVTKEDPVKVVDRFLEKVVNLSAY